MRGSSRRVQAGSKGAGSSVQDHEWDGHERRDSDRRAQPTRPWSRLLGPLRRAEGRRQEDRSGYVDVYSRTDVSLLIAVFLLNVADAFFTMIWLGRGGREANPVMDFFLDIGPGAFIIQKCFFVGFWLVILLMHKNFRFARLGLYAALGVYSILLVVHFGIIAFDVQPPEDDPIEPGTAIARPPPFVHRSVQIDSPQAQIAAVREAGVVASEKVARPRAE